MSLTERDQQIVLERESGDTLAAIGQRHGLTYQRVQMIVRDARRHIDRLELDLLRATKTGEHPTFLVPNQEQSGRQIALDYFQWVLDRLRERDVHVNVTTRNTPAGIAFQLEEVDE